MSEGDSFSKARPCAPRGERIRRRWLSTTISSLAQVARAACALRELRILWEIDYTTELYVGVSITLILLYTVFVIFNCLAPPAVAWLICVLCSCSLVFCLLSSAHATRTHYIARPRDLLMQKTQCCISTGFKLLYCILYSQTSAECLAFLSFLKRD